MNRKLVEWAYKVLQGDVRVIPTEENHAKAVAAGVIGQMLGNEFDCRYCKHGVRFGGKDAWFIITGNRMRVYDGDKIVGEYKIQRCPICGNYL